MKENQNTEWKESWRDEYLKWVCGFANADGGKLYIGIDDNGNITGIENAQKLLEDIPNKVKTSLGLIVEVNLLSENDKEYLEIVVEPYPFPVNYKGQYYYRSGSTKQELTGAALDKFLLRKQGKHWDSVPVPYIAVTDLHPPALDHFRKLAIQSRRLESNILDEPNLQLIEKLHLVEGNYLNRSAILLFYHDPEKYVTGACVKIGYFETDEDLLFQDVIGGNLFEQVERTMDLLLSKYLKAGIRYERIYRIEEFPVPEQALREAVINAVVHKDYSSCNPIQISVYSNRILIWNEGSLPQNWTIDKLKQKHTSVPFNPVIASTFFRAGMIEAWGRGTLKILEECKKAGLPEPDFRYEAPGFTIEFILKEPNRKKKTSEKTSEKASEIPPEKVRNVDITLEKTSEKASEKTSEKVIQLIKSNPGIGIKELAGAIGISQRAIEMQLNLLQKKNRLKRLGGRKFGYWVVID